MLNSNTIIAGLACVIGSAQAANDFTPHVFQEGIDQKLGVMADLDDFFANMGSEASEWEAVPKDEVEVEELNTELLSSSDSGPGTSPNINMLMMSPEDDHCGQMTGWNRILCERIPNNAVFWTLGAAMAILYSGRLFSTFLDGWSLVVVEGFNFERRYRRLRNGDQGPAKREQLATNGSIFFQIEVPMRDGLQSREYEEGKEYEMHLYSDWVYDTQTGELTAEGTTGSFVGSDQHEEIQDDGMVKRQHSPEEFSIILTARQMSSATTIANPSCVASAAHYYVDRASQNYRHACQPMWNQGSWLAMIGVHINPGKDNWDVPRSCCF